MHSSAMALVGLGGFEKGCPLKGPEMEDQTCTNDNEAEGKLWQLLKGSPILVTSEHRGNGRSSPRTLHQLIRDM